jgi:hypothetical protein
MSSCNSQNLVCALQEALNGFSVGGIIFLTIALVIAILCAVESFNDRNLPRERCGKCWGGGTYSAEFTEYGGGEETNCEMCGGDGRPAYRELTSGFFNRPNGKRVKIGRRGSGIKVVRKPNQ